MRCPNCGFESLENAKQCSSCGSSLHLVKTSHPQVKRDRSVSSYQYHSKSLLSEDTFSITEQDTKSLYNHSETVHNQNVGGIYRPPERQSSHNKFPGPIYRPHEKGESDNKFPLPVYKQMGRESCEKEYNRPIYNQQGKETIDNQYNRPSNQAQGETYPHKQQIQSILTPMKANRNYMNRICSICLAQIFFGDDITVCNKCDTAYHGECSPPGGCISKGCKVDDLPLGTIMPDIAPDEQFCTMCGNVIKKSAVKCYHCGSIVDQQFRMGRTFSQVHSNTGVIALLIGISAFLVSWCPFIGLPIGVLAIYQGSKAKQDYNQYSLGNIGYITGIIAVVLSVFVFLIFIISGITGK